MTYKTGPEVNACGHLKLVGGKRLRSTQSHNPRNAYLHVQSSLAVAGQSFGELALLGDDNKHRRNASVIADDDTDLLVIERDLFEETLKVSSSYVLLFKILN